MDTSDSKYDSIIPTAILTAYPKTLTDIPYAVEMFNELKKENIDKELIVDRLAVNIEARFKLTNKLLDRSNIVQVVELAAGYSTRGLSYAEKGFAYVELDLEDVCTRKVKALSNFIDIPDNLSIISANVLKEDEFNKCKKYLDSKKEVAIINEGLLRYLDFDEKKVVANNIKKTLIEYGGVWITCDVTPKEYIKKQDKSIPNFNKNLSSISDRNRTDWRFENINHVREFYDEIGFDVIEVHDFNELSDELVSPKKLGLKENIDQLLTGAIVVVMKLKNNRR